MRWWLGVGVGGMPTMKSYGLEVPFRFSVMPEALSDADAVALHRDLLAAVPPEHRVFFDSLEMTYQEGPYFCVHAGVRPGVPLDRQKPQDLVWIRDEFRLSTDPFEGKIVVHGHTITQDCEPEVLPNRIGIDTGAYMSYGQLTCAVLKNRRPPRFISSRGPR
jgi:serine/threonine protein phosphatase 1